MKNREIKFRAWDLEKKEWIGDNGTTFTSKNPKEGVVALLLGGHLRVFSANCMKDGQDECMESVSHSEYESIHPMETKPTYKKQYILLQYTGLKDKNGKEIYEGDIIKYIHSDNKIKYGEIKSILESFIVRVGTINFKMSGLLIYAVNTGEVIGNIYENPKLDPRYVELKNDRGDDSGKYENKDLLNL